MILFFDPATVHLLAGFGLGSFMLREPVVVEPNPYAAEMAALGYPGPFSIERSEAVLVKDRDGKPLDLAMPGDDGPANRRRRAEITCLALNRLCEFAVPEDKLDPDHLDGVRAESARFKARTGQLADAAE